MELDTLTKLGQAVGGFFVILSIIYLARQVRQNSKLLITENYGRVLDRMSAVQSRLAAEPEFHHIVVVGAQSPGALSGSERVRFTWAMYELFGAGEFMYNQARDDSLPPEVWERWEATIAWWASHPGIRDWWEAKPTPFTSDYEALVNGMIRGEHVDPGTVRRWERFVAGEDLSAA